MRDGYAVWSIHFRRQPRVLREPDGAPLYVPLLEQLCPSPAGWYRLVLRYHWSVEQTCTSDGDPDTLVEIVPTSAELRLHRTRDILEPALDCWTLTSGERDDLFDSFVDRIEAQFVEGGYGDEIDSGV